MFDDYPPMEAPEGGSQEEPDWTATIPMEAPEQPAPLLMHSPEEIHQWIAADVAAM